MKGYLVPVHQFLDFARRQENIRKVRVFGNQEPVSIPMGLDPADDDVSLGRKAIMPPAKFHDLPFIRQLAESLAQFLPPGGVRVERLRDIGQSERLAFSSPDDA